MVATAQSFNSNSPDVACRGVKSCGAGILDLMAAYQAMRDGKRASVAYTFNASALGLTASSCPAGLVQPMLSSVTQVLLGFGAPVRWNKVFGQCAKATLFNQHTIAADFPHHTLNIYFGDAEHPIAQYSLDFSQNAVTRCAPFEQGYMFGCLQ